MSKVMRPFVILLLFLSLFIGGCSDKEKLADLEKKQEEIIAKLNAIESNQKEMLKFFRPRRPQVDLNKVHNLPVGSSPVKGRKDAAVTITEFSDYQCPYCSRVQPTLKKVMEAYPDNVKIVFKNFPLSSIHPQAKDAARAAHAAGEQGKYWEMHDLIFKNAKSLNDEKFRALAVSLNLDIDKFMADFKSGRYDRQIEEDIELGRSVGVRGTPTFFINGKRVARRSFDDFKNTIDGYLKKN